MPDIGAYLSPRTVAVVGASADETKLRGRIMRVLLSQPFQGDIYPISRRSDEIMGLKAYPSVADTPKLADLAILIVPAAYVVPALRECAEAGVKAAHIITSGFAEEPGETGVERQHEIRQIADYYDMAVCGPNSQGFMNAHANLTATFSPAARHFSGALLPEYRTQGYVTAVAQSGGLGFSFFDHGRPKGLPFNYVVTTGNEAALEHLDIVDHLIDTGETDVFLIFMEDVKSPQKLRAVAEKALRAGKPLIVTKVGRSEAGQRAAVSHTGALASANSGYQAIFDRYGIIESAELEEMVDIAGAFSHLGGRLPAGTRVGITTSSGGAGGMMADALFDAGLQVPLLDEATRAEIDRHLPSYGNSQNPVDATAQAVRQLGYYRLNAMVAASPEVDAIVCITSAKDAPAVLAAQSDLERVKRDFDKPVIFYSYTHPAPESVGAFAASGIPLIWNLRHCGKAVSALAQYRQTRERFLKPQEIWMASRDTARHDAQVGLDVGAGSVLTEYQAQPVLSAYGLRTAGGQLVCSAESAARVATDIAGPVAMKVQSADIIHKTEVGAVVLSVPDGAEAHATFDRLMGQMSHLAREARIDGVLVQRMVPAGVEVILGIQRDPSFGPLLMVGLGGVMVEVLGDVAFGPVPMNRDEAAALLDRLQGRQLLEAFRGRQAADVAALLDAMVALSQLAADFGEQIDEIDLNPVFVHAEGEGLTIADALIVKRNLDTGSMMDQQP